MPETDGGPRPSSRVLLAAGEGTRMRSALPKVLHPIGGATLLGHAVAAVAALAPEHLAVVVGHGRDQVVRRGRRAGRAAGPRRWSTAVQEQQLGTGHAVRCGLEALPSGLTGAVVVTYGDVPLLEAGTLQRAARRARRRRRGRHAAHRRARRPHRLRPGAARRRTARSPGSSSTRDATAEQRAVREINSGVYAFDAAFLAAGLVRAGEPQRQGELYLTDLVAAAAAAGAAGAAASLCPTPGRSRASTTGSSSRRSAPS